MSETMASRVPQPGEMAPDFDLPDGEGRQVRLSELRGKTVVMYFYPKDDTPGCTTEACSFRDAWRDLEDRGVVVLGVSKDDQQSHQRFAQKYGLPFTLLSDEDTTVAQSYGVWGERSMYGRQFIGMARTTFLIGPDGTVQHVWEHVKPAGHAEEVLAYVEAHR